jgi:hypothetical protein
MAAATATAVPTGSAFRTGYAAACAASAKADAALALAIRQCDISPEIHKIAIERSPAQYAVALRQIADVVASLPMLREDVQRADAIAAAYAEFACYRCNGTGDYSGPTNATRQGRPYCFTCNGTGDSRTGK